MRRALSLLPLLAGFAPAGAQEAEVQRALLHRAQQSAEFALRVQQFERALRAGPQERPRLEDLFLSERHAQEALHARQQRELAQPREDHEHHEGRAQQRAQWGPRLAP